MVGKYLIPSSFPSSSNLTLIFEIIAGGLPERTIDHAEKMVEFAMEMIEALNIYNHSNEFLTSRGLTLSLRVGVNTGPVVAVLLILLLSSDFFYPLFVPSVFSV